MYDDQISRYERHLQKTERIEELERENDELKLKYGWKDWPENDPPYETTERWEAYLCESKYGYIIPLWYIGGGWFHDQNSQHFDYSREIIRFRELPEVGE
jgi:hypothetical protein